MDTLYSTKSQTTSSGAEIKVMTEQDEVYQVGIVRRLPEKDGRTERKSTSNFIRRCQLSSSEDRVK